MSDTNLIQTREAFESLRTLLIGHRKINNKLDHIALLLKLDEVLSRYAPISEMSVPYNTTLRDINVREMDRLCILWDRRFEALGVVTNNNYDKDQGMTVKEVASLNDNFSLTTLQVMDEIIDTMKTFNEDN